MPYDFETLVSRKNTGSSKWNMMDRLIGTELPDDVIPFSTADMELKHPPEITKALQDYIGGNILGYTHAHPAYHRAVCGFMKRRHNWEISAEWIVPYPGIVPALFTMVRAFTKPGDGIIIMPPVYYPFYMAIERNGRNIVENKLIDNGTRYEIDYADLEEKASDPNTTMLIFCSPHNPVGRVWTAEELKKVAEICLKHDVLLISDEIHFDLIMPGYQHTVMTEAMPEIREHCVICTAPSKTFNLAGLCVSNLIIPSEKLREAFRKEVGILGEASINALGLKACQVAYTECDAWLEELIALIDANRQFCEDFIKDHLPAIRVRPLEGTYLQWWDCRGLGLDEKALEKMNLEKAHFVLNEGYIFGEGGSGFERINLACPTAYLEKALLRLKAALTETSA